MNTTLTNNTEQKRFELDTDGQISFIEYAMDNEGIVALLHTEVPEALKGGGVGTRLVKLVLAQIEADNMKVLPACSFVMNYMKRNPDTRSLLATKV
jgi:predicted GNAT family acetyltransferase